MPIEMTDEQDQLGVDIRMCGILAGKLPKRMAGYIPRIKRVAEAARAYSVSAKNENTIEEIQAKLAQSKAENERHKTAQRYWELSFAEEKERAQQAESELSARQAEVERLRECVEWYARDATHIGDEARAALAPAEEAK